MNTSSHFLPWKIRYSMLYIFGYASLAFVISGLGPLIPFKAEMTGHPETSYSIVFTCRGLGYLTGSFLVGKIYHLFNPHLLLACYFMILGFTSYIGVLTESIPLFAFFFYFNGIGCAGIDVLTQALTVQIHEDKIDTWMQVLHFCYGIGAFTSPIIMSGMGESAFKLFGIITAMMGLLVLGMDSPRLHKETTDEDADFDVTRKVIPKDLNFILCTMFFFYLGAEVGFGGWISTYATMTGAADSEEAAFCSGVFWVFITLGRMLAIPASTRFSINGQLMVLIYSCICSIVVSFVLIGVGYIRLAVYLGSAWFGLSMSAIYPLLMSLPNYLKFRMTAKNTSRFVVWGAVGESIIPIVFGVMMGSLGSSMLFIIALIISVIFLGLHKKALEYSYSSKNKTDIEMELFYRA